MGEDVNVTEGQLVLTWRKWSTPPTIFFFSKSPSYMNPLQPTEVKGDLAIWYQHSTIKQYHNIVRYEIILPYGSFEIMVLFKVRYLEKKSVP